MVITLAKKSFEQKDKASDKKMKVKEDSKKDIKMDSKGMQNLKAAFMGRKTNKK